MRRSAAVSVVAMLRFQNRLLGLSKSTIADPGTLLFGDAGGTDLTEGGMTGRFGAWTVS